ncbi:rhomboid protease GluP [Breznakia sp. PF5-3]|uniref:rhomboid family intramembrane serine protease n=1 Tax=unclassified Breznakia TaxID=2623764 RepID=UPI002405D26F|nr:MULTISPECIES: rhomboid family intramembrane serine protease [unclassified Breznakia]MDF9824087.1 rhomboid protease GluP [Breznakia sp. PM6-1]MDF9834847.1 rhomboid protease GluP [Breznakia sp. PF5-3]MDF9837131.1 rhomboid protease GluP [Breznakia sp. PFB2-8]MDF9859056.1 rhomboid protease GluP [Breznakia sp. PH5-24]
MELQDKDVTLYQIMDCLVENYEYNIIRFSGQKKDLWLTNKDHKQYPIIRLNAVASSSMMFETEYLEKVKTFLNRFIESDRNVLIINTNKESAEFAENEFTQVLLNENTEDINLIETFPALKSAIHKVENKQEEIKRINKNLQNHQNKRLYEQQKEANKVPKFTGILIAVFIAIFFLTFGVSNYLGGWGSDNVWNDTLIICGAYYKTFIVAANEYWRLFTAGLLHMNISHLLMNMIALYTLGKVIEKVFTKAQYLIILIVSVIVGNIVTFVVMDNLMSVGVSGGLYGLMAAVIVIAFENRTIKIPQVRNSILRIVSINLLISLLPGISMTAHLGGFLAGAVLGFIFIKSDRWKAYKPHVTICFVIFLGCLGYLGYNNNSVEPLFPKTDYQVIKHLHNLGLDGYADYIEDRVVTLYEE